MLPEY